MEYSSFQLASPVGHRYRFLHTIWLTQCYLPPGRDHIPAITAAKWSWMDARLSWPSNVKAVHTALCWEMVIYGLLCTLGVTWLFAFYIPVIFITFLFFLTIFIIKNVSKSMNQNCISIVFLHRLLHYLQWMDNATWQNYNTGSSVRNTVCRKLCCLHWQTTNVSVTFLNVEKNFLHVSKHFRTFKKFFVWRFYIYALHVVVGG